MSAALEFLCVVAVLSGYVGGTGAAVVYVARRLGWEVEL